MKPEQAVDKILKELDGRKGFDEWWGSLDGQIQEEIRSKLTAILAEGVEPGK